MRDTAQAVVVHLRPLVGLRLSASYRVADMRVYHFGTLRAAKRGQVGEFTLHVQWPWRIETADRIVTGRHDLFQPAEEAEDFDWEAWDWSDSETLQDKLVAEFLSKTGPVVEDVAADAHGGAILRLSGGYRLVLFPAASQGEEWRLLPPEAGAKHFVVSGGRVEEDQAGSQ